MQPQLQEQQTTPEAHTKLQSMRKGTNSKDAAAGWHEGKVRVQAKIQW